MDLGNAVQTFYEESKENLSNSEKYLLNLKDDNSEETLNALFREIHTIKGSAGMFGFSYVSDFTHGFENMLDALRKGEINLNDNFIDVSLEANDYINGLIIYLEENSDSNFETAYIEKGNEITKKINLIRGKLKQVSEDNEHNENEIPSVKEDSDKINFNDKFWHISVRFNKNIFQNGLDPYSFIKYLKNFSTIKSVSIVDEFLPDKKDYNPIDCYLGFEIDIEGEELSKEKIQDAFEFVIDDCTINILPPESNIYDYCKMISSLDDSVDKLGEILYRAGTITKSELEEALNSQKNGECGENSNKLLGEVLIENKTIRKEVIEEALEKQVESRKAQDKKIKSMRIDADKIDQLITLVGELVISSANVREKSEKKGDLELLESTSVMLRLVDEIRDHTMNIRMVPIGEVFSKFRRIVFDLSKKMNKKIDLEIKGGETELDKTLIEKINDPLLHIIRNAADHGIETLQERIDAGKPELSLIKLNAYYESGTVVVEISDDGKGLNKDKIYSKAVEKGLITPDENITDEALWQLLFEPGFSTSNEITDVSGRGVGMDVVKKNIESMRGSIDIETTPGEGTIFKIHLPLTLAIIDGFLVRSGGMPFVIPLDMVYECTEINIRDKRDSGNFFNLRDNVLPYLEINKLFNFDVSQNKKHDDVIIVEYIGKKAGLVVDKLEGELQTVIKPLGKLFKNIKWISGATIMGNGDVALILDIPRLIKYVQESTSGAN